MKETYWGYWLILLGVLIIGIMMLVNSTTTNSTQDYYTLKEVTQASMVDSLDFAYYRLYGDVKMSEQKFVENFIRRFADNTNLSNTYTVSFYDLYEVPPKVSVQVSTKSNTYNVANNQTTFDVVNKIDAILEVGVPDSGSTSNTESICPISVNTSFGTALKNNTDNILSNTKASNILNDWKAANYDAASLKKIFVKYYPDLATTKGKDLYSKYSEFESWNSKGYITIHTS